MKLRTTNEKDTYRLGTEIGKLLKKGDIIGLNGDLGAGKTLLTRGIAEGMGIDDYITSPSFTIINEYEGELPLYHFDVYRIGSPDEMYEIGFEEYLFGRGVCIIEWSDMINDLLPDSVIDIRIAVTGDETREINIENTDRFNSLQEMIL